MSTVLEAIALCHWEYAWRVRCITNLAAGTPEPAATRGRAARVPPPPRFLDGERLDQRAYERVSNDAGPIPKKMGVIAAARAARHTHSPYIGVLLSGVRTASGALYRLQHRECITAPPWARKSAVACLCKRRLPDRAPGRSKPMQNLRRCPAAVRQC